MATPQARTFQDCAYDTYRRGYDVHGDLQLEFEEYLRHLSFIIEKHLGPRASITEISSWVNNLHTNDLYLCTASLLEAKSPGSGSQVSTIGTYSSMLVWRQAPARLAMRSVVRC